MHSPIVTLLETIAQPALILDCEKRVKLANTAFFEAYSLTAAHTLRQPLLDLEGGAWNLPALRRLLEAIDSDSDSYVEADIDVRLPASGQHRLHLRAHRLAAEEPDVWAVLALEERMLERLQAVEMQDSERWLQALAENLPVALWTLNAQGIVTMVMGKGSSGFSFSPETIVGRSIFEVYADFPQILVIARRMLNGETFSEIVQSNGRVWQAHYAPLYGPQGDIVGALSTGIDITQSWQAEMALQRQTELLQTIMEHIPVMIAYFAPNREWIYANHYFEERLGWKFEQWKARTEELFESLYPDPVIRQHAVEFILAAEGKWGDFRVHTSYEHEMDTAWANIRLSDGSNIGIGIDVTERKQAERENLAHLERASILANLAQMMAESGLEYQRALEIVVQVVTEYVGDGCVITLLDENTASLAHVTSHHRNPAALAAMRTALLPTYFTLQVVRELLETGRPIVMNHIAPEDMERLLEAYPPYLTYVQQFGLNSLILVPLHTHERVFGMLGVLRDTSTQPFSPSDEVFLQAIADQAGLAVQNARLFEQVRAAHERMRQLAQEVMAAQEAERQRVSRELHDEAGQALTALKISLQMIANDLPPTEAALRDRVSEMVQLTDRTMEQVRLLARALRPPALDMVGLATTIEGYCGEFGRRTHLQVSYSGTLNRSLPDSMSIALYRCLQEGLTNAAKHARASQIKVTLEETGEAVVLTIEDNGRGITETVPAEGGIGLAGLRERFEALNGLLEIVSTPQRGTRLVASVPVDVSS